MKPRIRIIGALLAIGCAAMASRTTARSTSQETQAEPSKLPALVGDVTSIAPGRKSFKVATIKVAPDGKATEEYFDLSLTEESQLISGVGVDARRLPRTSRSMPRSSFKLGRLPMVSWS